MSRPNLREGAALVAARDASLAVVIDRVGPVRLRRRQADAFQALARSIVFQQLAGRAASAIHARFEALFDGAGPSPEGVLMTSDARLRAAGLSGAKAASIRDLATKVADGAVPLHDVARLSDDEIVSRLSTVRGIGRWTAEMFLIFQLHRPDVWPVDDLGVRRGWQLAHHAPAIPSPRELAAEGDRFRPHRTVAAWYCWQAVHLARGGA